MAVQYVNQTAQHIFLTGKAGTGKTTFLKYIKETSHKKLAVVAPTGVAAINAGGVTIHSFFQLPFGSFLPVSQSGQESISGNFYNKQSMFRNLRFSNDKRELIQELDLLIIDEVSMVRADLLDAVDTMLRYLRRQPHRPFGGVQMLYIGDLSQLPPVVNDREWSTLGQHYESPFFFHAKAVLEHPPLYLELKKIYRQSDATFIKVLNNIRNSKVTAEDFELLHQYYRPGFKPEKKGEYITLTTHNAKADIINQKELELLPGKRYTYEAQIDGDFNERAYPAENKLQLKEGAQIMFIRNDKGEERRYYNGKLATIKSIKGEAITVIFPEDNTELLLEKETWRNVRYHYDKEQDQIDEEEIGTFIQFPIRLAWAITIHKSQGLTFEKAIIDAGESFAPGQVYVALSRLTSLEGLILYSRINSNCISTDAQASAFAATELAEEILERQLKEEQKQYTHDLLLEVFNWQKIVSKINIFLQDMEGRRIPLLDEAKALAEDLLQKAKAHQKIANTFSGRLQHMLVQVEQNGYGHVNERVSAAGKYFSDALLNDLFLPLQHHYEDIKGKSKVKKYLKDLQDVAATCKQKKDNLEQAMRITTGLEQGIDPGILYRATGASEAAKDDAFMLKTPPIASKPAKGESHRISLALFEAGKSIEAIAKERNLAIGTIEGHLVSFISTGKLSINALMSEEKIEAIEQVMKELGEAPSSQIKEKLGEGFSYGDIRAVINHQKLLKEA